MRKFFQINVTKLWSSLTRLKSADVIETETKLARVLNLFDLTALGVGSTLGLGVYVLAGSVAYDVAGPAVSLSFLIAALASAFAAICYAEFAARVPKAGSAYVYSYVTIGEFVAFTIGWNMILEYIVGTASVSRGFSGYFDSLIHKRMSNAMSAALPIDVAFLGDYPDFMAFGLILILTALLSFGVKESSFFNNIFTVVNMLTILIVIIAGSIYADTSNWSIPQDKVPAGFGTGGFMPFGIAGVMTGAAKCFFGFVGFDGIATTGEEAINPRRNIPLAIIISLIIVFFSYFGISTVLTLMVPYYQQDRSAPFPAAFESVNLTSVKWIVTGGAIFALCTCLLGAMIPLPRVLYAMGSDGIIFKKLSKVNDYTKTPLLATVISGIFSACMALIFDLDQLIDMMSIGTLMAYSIVAIGILVLRYQNGDLTKEITLRRAAVIKQLFNISSRRQPTALSSAISKMGVFLFGLTCILWCCMDKLYEFGSTASIVALSFFGVILIFIMIVISCQPVSSEELSFKVPLVPLVPCLSIFSNFYLMFQLDVNTWIRFLIWLAIGYIIYFSYGIRHSTQKSRNEINAQAATKIACKNKIIEADCSLENGKNHKS